MAVLAAVAIGALALLVRHWRGGVVTAANAATLKSVAAIRVARADLTRSATLTAEMRPWQEVDVHAKVTGYLKTITVDIGDRVRQGQVLAVLDVPELLEDQNKAQADYVISKLDYDRLIAVQKRNKALLAQEEIDKSLAIFDQAKATLQRVKVLLDYCNITAPFAGVITWRFVDPGALIQAGTASNARASGQQPGMEAGSRSVPIVHLAELAVLRLDFPAPEAIVPLIKTGMPVEVVVQATGETVHGSVARIAERVDLTTRTMTVEVDLKNDDLHLKPGMYANATIALETKQSAVSAPVQAVSLGDKPSVLLINADGTAQLRPVTIGIQTPDRVEITSGVAEGDVLVYGSRGEIAAGMKVAPKFIDTKSSTE